MILTAYETSARAVLCEAYRRVIFSCTLEFLDHKVQIGLVVSQHVDCH